MHPLDKFKFCPVCGSGNFKDNDFKSKKCANCGFVYYLNPSSATVAFIFNERNELLVVTRKFEPAKGTLDLPGGFCDIGETTEEGVKREIKEETNLDVVSTKYLFSIPNKYMYSGFLIPTLDTFFLGKVETFEGIKPMDDTDTISWIKLEDIKPELFGLDSIRKGVILFCKGAKELME